MRFVLGDKVIERDTLTAHSSYTVYEVVGFLKEAILVTVWGDGFDGEIRHYDFLDNHIPGSRTWRTEVLKYQESEFFNPEEALVELSRLEKDSNQIEKEFENVRDKVRLKMDQAAALVKEAREMIQPLDREFEDLIQECKELYLALNGGGWSHSTMECKFGR